MSSISPPVLSFDDRNDGIPPPSPFQNLKPSILIIILILSTTILLSISLCLLLRHLNRHLSPSPAAAITSHSVRRISPQLPQLSLIDSLPLFPFSSIKHRNSTTAIIAGDCAVCLSKFQPPDQLRLLPLCCHAFHAPCIDTWLQSNQTCPLCRSPIHASDSDLIKALSTTNDATRAESFRLEIGSLSRRHAGADSALESRRSYSIGSFEYIVEGESEIITSQTHRRSVSDNKEAAAQSMAVEPSLVAEVDANANRSWLKEYVERLSFSRSFRSSGRFFTGSSRRSEVAAVGDYDVEVEANRVGEEITELFRWLSGV